jgi:UDPglucose--hexose-1-phosphate uridylyltransferase
MPELRIDPICGRYVYIAEDRAGRPNDFVKSPGDAVAKRARQYHCPFCAGHEAATPDASATVLDAAGRWQVRVVPNKYPAVALDGVAPPALGAHEVIIESPRHLADVVELDATEFAAVLGVYRDRLRHWVGDDRLRHAVIFKNSGSAAGASLEHVHSQLIALPHVPAAVQAEIDGAERFHAARGRCAYCDLIQREVDAGDRLVKQSHGYVAMCAYAGRQPYETWILPEEHAARFDMLEDGALFGLALLLQDVLRRLYAQADRLAYNLILHTGPFDAAHAAAFHWHWELIPRSSQLAGFELGAGAYINPVSPERAAQNLRNAILPTQAQPA